MSADIHRDLKLLLDGWRKRRALLALDRLRAAPHRDHRQADVLPRPHHRQQRPQPLYPRRRQHRPVRNHPGPFALSATVPRNLPPSSGPPPPDDGDLTKTPGWTRVLPGCQYLQTISPSVQGPLPPPPASSFLPDLDYCLASLRLSSHSARNPPPNSTRYPMIPHSPDIPAGDKVKDPPSILPVNQ